MTVPEPREAAAPTDLTGGAPDPIDRTDRTDPTDPTGPSRSPARSAGATAAAEGGKATVTAASVTPASVAAGAPSAAGTAGTVAGPRAAAVERAPSPPGKAEAPPRSIWRRPFRGLTLGIISVVSLVAFEASAVHTAMPVAAHALDGIPLYAYAFSGYFTASLFAMALSGEWCDRSGPLTPLFTGVATFGGGLVISGAAQDMWTFVGGRAVQGAGGGLVIVALYVVVGRAYPERLRPAVMASFSAAWVVPVLVGPVVSGTVTQQLGWRWVFLGIPVLVLLPLTVMLPALRRLPRPAGGTVNRRRVLLALGVAAGAGLLQYAGQDRTPAALLPAAAGLALLVPCVLRLLPRGTFRAGHGLPAVVLLRGVAAGSFLGAETFVPLMLVTERGLSVTLAGLALTGGGLTWALGSYAQSRARLEPHRERLMQVGMGLMAVAIAGPALALLDGLPGWAPWTLVAVSWAVGGFGMGLTISSASVLLLRLSRPEEAGTNSASLQVSDALGNIVLVGLSGILFVSLGGGAVAAGAHTAGVATGGAGAAGGHGAAFTAVYLAMGAVALTGAWIATRLSPRAAEARTG
ncbi:MFS transporter [Streptomyces zingiberis]|uniref:MFS transporter n=1 Tax=Streptomyces zingiberis TaxID=2053010 RepID=A0ABX1BVQ6_9ACTN|nr:MFS transporter [Streptomyces zingiberis]NJQ01799.1 MFS transporter [Streptomyces zingiberis]